MMTCLVKLAMAAVMASVITVVLKAAADVFGAETVLVVAIVLVIVMFLMRRKQR